MLDVVGTEPVLVTMLRMFPSCRCLDRWIRGDRIGAVQVKGTRAIITLNDRLIVQRGFATNHAKDRGFPGGVGEFFVKSSKIRITVVCKSASSDITRSDSRK